MEDVSVLKRTSITGNKTPEEHVKGKKIFQRRISFNPAIVSLIAEGGINFFRYLKSLHMSGETNLIVLSSKHHYYYDENDLKNVRTLINLKKLNLIKHLDIFLNTLVRILPPNTNFIGCFSDGKTVKENSFPLTNPSRLYSRLINFLHSRTEYIMKKNEVLELLERNGFKTINMKEMNGLIYFNSQNVGLPV